MNTIEITNNEGKKVMITESLFYRLEQNFLNGDWAVYIRVDGNTHCIILPENF